MARITVLFNNICGDEKLKSGRGSAMLLDMAGELILFDTGPDGEALLYNLNNLGFEARRIKKVAISHKHRDHAGGLEHLLRKNPNTEKVYVPRGFTGNVKNPHVVLQKTEIGGNIYLFPVKGTARSLFIEEQALVADSARGLVVLTGCAHPGIARMCKTIKKHFGKKLYAVFGGFHLEHHPAFVARILARSLKRLGIEIIGPNHCIGGAAINAFMDVFKERFLLFSAGKTFNLD